MKDLVLATNNPHKVDEIKSKLGNSLSIKTLNELGFYDDIPETAGTLQGNASQKAHFLYDKFGCNCFADDTGLEVEALNGEPGVYSARYAGVDKDSEANMQKLLQNLSGKENRKARFRTVISLIWEGEEHFFEGIVEGTILTEKHGSEGFGYDPIFQPNGYSKSFAELSMEEKNSISHRGKAVEKLLQFLNKNL
ncbi:MAG: non-canonical purine NTP diphosphatase [Paludibacteraceae bacterium]|nr:non-canonical purine NTP diphosphatase [Paludibacteraceae bacterium]MBR5973412.1 non-canonical purine NTP diphosphatase [Paludibacteraceae bacterium]